ncbi:hypothetical protein ORI20_13840 [Mycobacterium sp. CVI_P3]|uniref:Polyketide cyclase n=1 Tax=Mycobacterium pinniadriaticum TaxID=2994102 RepID=A0ABT3SE49_9MYCO|nr:hypothetical protein [Mycobacterium pinniadriaticum]MCX2931361.1 hypothetical protein [Mycobacterium pinniadriaticum]MCX2937785.1 hypothetical protein [Mycobacterium pinniadriaticum]
MTTPTAAQVATTAHHEADPIADAIMAMPLGGTWDVEITVGGERYMVHHWEITTDPVGDQYLKVAWLRRSELIASGGRMGIRWRTKSFVKQLRNAIKHP